MNAEELREIKEMLCKDVQKHYDSEIKDLKDSIKDIRGWIWKFILLALGDAAAIILFFVKIQFFPGSK